jgi:hypothetical protein
MPRYSESPSFGKPKLKLHPYRLVIGDFLPKGHPVPSVPTSKSAVFKKSHLGFSAVFKKSHFAFKKSYFVMRILL